jgi:hypothetical protein
VYAHRLNTRPVVWERSIDGYVHYWIFRKKELVTMKIILGAVLSLMLSSVAVAEQITFPGSDMDGTPYTLSVFKDHITVFGGHPPSNLPLQYPIVDGRFSACGTGTGICFVITPSSLSAIDIAVRNSWVALMMKASATGDPVTVTWHENDTDAALCLTIAGAICVVNLN